MVTLLIMKKWANLNWARITIFIVNSAPKIVGNKLGRIYIGSEISGKKNVRCNLGPIIFTDKI